MPAPLTNLANGLAIEALQKIGRSFTVSTTLDIARPETIDNFVLFGAALENAYRKGLASRLIGEVRMEEKLAKALKDLLVDVSAGVLDGEAVRDAQTLLDGMDDMPEIARYTCKDKGGQYELLGTATGAGKMKLFEPFAVYRDTKTGRMYFRTVADFNERMEKLP